MEDSKNLELEFKKKDLESKKYELEQLCEELKNLIATKEEFYYWENKQRKIQRKIDRVTREINRIRSEIDRINVEIYVLENNPVVSNENLDIYLREGNIEDGYGFFEIFLHGTSTKIGRVTLYTYPMNAYGNVGYGLEEEYRGHRFMLQSLEILKETMIKMKIFKPIFTVEPDNLPSVHTIRNFGGTLIKDHQEYNTWYDTYEVDLMAEKPSKKK